MRSEPSAGIPLTTMCLSLVSAVAALNDASLGQTNTLYASAVSDTQGPGRVLAIRSGTALWSHPLRSVYEFPLAVHADVRTFSIEPSRPGEFGRQFSLLGVETGVTYPGEPGVGFSTYMWDGTSDGVYNYGIDEMGRVIRFSREWDNLSLLFIAADFGRAFGPGAGISLDPTSGDFFVSSGLSALNPGEIYRFSHDGVFLETVVRSRHESLGLAFDPISRTLWTSSLDSLMQFDSTTGQPLGQVPLSGETYGIIAMEFNTAAVPAPASLGTVVLACGACGLLGRRRRS